jgi:hypothetical protein
MSQKLRREKAYHEASHAVIARLQGVEVVGVLMFQTEGANASVFSRSASYYAEPDTAARIAAIETDLRIAIAGPVGNTLHVNGGQKGRHMADGETDDIVRCKSMAVEIAMLRAGEPLPHHEEDFEIEIDSSIVHSANVILAQLRNETKLMLERNWAAVERVAKVLMTCDLLDQKDLDRLIADTEMK